MNQFKNGDPVGCNNCGNPYEYKKGEECPNCGKDFIGSVKRIRKLYTKETYSPKITKELLFNLYNFLNMKIVEEKELFSEYDKASLLCAIEHIDDLEKQIQIYKAADLEKSIKLNERESEIERLKDGIDKLEKLDFV
jgi:predicted RNA-binding Zn-ribbon protein involved in translation (DUF1610 family)